MKKWAAILSSVLSLALSVAAQQPSAAQPSSPAPIALGTAGIGDLLVAPPRLIFEGRQRAGELSLVNTGAKTSTYRISLVNIEMTAEGGLKQVENPNARQLLEKSLIRFSPRQVTLEPRLAQSIRIELRKPADLPDGEYRVHMLFQGVPPPELTGGSVDPKDQDAKGIRIALIPIYGVSIPLFVRHGVTTADVSITDMKIEKEPDGQSYLSMLVSRKGTRSVYGDLNATFIAPPQRPQVIAIGNAIAVYPEIASRTVKIPIRLPEGVVLAHGRIHVTYTDAERDDRPLLAESELAVP